MWPFKAIEIPFLFEPGTDGLDDRLCCDDDMVRTIVGKDPTIV
jgi:hypothetical protein